jgi:hypothetical protein
MAAQAGRSCCSVASSSRSRFIHMWKSCGQRPLRFAASACTYTGERTEKKATAASQRAGYLSRPTTKSGIQSNARL